MKKICIYCNGRGNKLQPILCGNITTLMAVPCSYCGGKGEVDEK